MHARGSKRSHTGGKCLGESTVIKACNGQNRVKSWVLYLEHHVTILTHTFLSENHHANSAPFLCDNCALFLLFTMQIVSFVGPFIALGVPFWKSPQNTGSDIAISVHVSLSCPPWMTRSSGQPGRLRLHWSVADDLWLLYCVAWVVSLSSIFLSDLPYFFTYFSSITVW